MSSHFSHVIKVDDEVYAHLQDLKKDPADTPNRVLRRLLHLPVKSDHEDGGRARRLLTPWRSHPRN